MHSSLILIVLEETLNCVLCHVFHHLRCVFCVTDFIQGVVDSVDVLLTGAAFRCLQLIELIERVLRQRLRLETICWCDRYFLKLI